MNRGIHRIVFNAARGLRVAVQETACGHTSGGAAGNTARRNPPGPIRTHLAVLAMLAAGAWAVPAAAQIVADPSAPGSQRPTVLAGPNGVPVVNIQTPSAAGVSRNTYRQFDVQKPGVILNNARDSNPWLAAGSARVILNEVNSSQPSQLRGAVTVQGSRAEVIVANPSGIQADGASFVNASRVTLTTGTARVDKGTLQGFDVRQGSIGISGQGLNTKGASYTDILSRAASIAGKVDAGNGGELTVATGAQFVDYATGATTAGKAAGTKPAVAIDTAALGGMYAGRITLLATEAGVGVRNAGTLQAASQLIVTADGRLENTGRMQAPVASIATVSGDIDNKGALQADKLLMASAGRDLLLSGNGLEQGSAAPATLLLQAGRDISVAANSRIASTGSVTSGGQTQAGQVTLAAGRDIKQAQGSQVEARGAVQLQADNRINVQQATVRSTHDTATLLAASSMTLQTATVAGQKVHIETGAPFRNTQSAISVSNTLVQGTNQATIIASGNLTLGGTTASNAAATSIESAKGSVHLQSGNKLQMTPQAAVRASRDVNMVANGTLLLDGKAAATGAAGAVKVDAGGDLFLSGASQSLLGGTQLTAKGGLTLEATGPDGIAIAGHSGPAAGQAAWSTLKAGKDLRISAYDGAILTTGLQATANNASLAARNTVQVQALAPAKPDSAALKSSVVNARGNLIVGSTQGSVQLQASTLKAGGQAQIIAKQAIGATTVHDGSLKPDAKPTGAVAAQLNAQGVQMQAGSVDLQGAAITAQTGHIAITAETGSASLKDGGGRRGTLNADKNIAVHAAKAVTLTNLSAASANGSLGITSATGAIQATGNSLTAGDVLSFSSKGGQNHTNGTYSGGALSIYNQSGTQTLNASTLTTTATKSAAAQSVSGQLSIESGGGIKANAATKLQAATDLSIVTGTGDITITPQKVTGTAAGLNLAQNQFSAGRNLGIVARSGVLTLQGLSGTNGNASARVVSLTQPGQLTLGGAAVNIQGAKLRSSGDMGITAYGGNVLIDGVRSDFSSMTPSQRVASLVAERDAVDAQIKQIFSDPEFVALNSERQRLGNIAWSCIAVLKNTYSCREAISQFSEYAQKLKPYEDSISVLGQEKADFDKYIAIVNRPARGSENLGAQLQGRNIQIRATQGITVQGSAVKAAQGVTLEAAGALPADTTAPNAEQQKAVGIQITGLTDRYEYGQAGSKSHAWALFSTASVIEGATVQVKTLGSADSRLIVNDSEIRAVKNGTLTLQSQGDMRLEAGQEEIYSYEQSSYKTGKWYKRKKVTETRILHDINVSPALLNGGSIDLKSGGSIHAHATQFEASQGIKITAANALSLYAVPEVSYSQVDIQKKSSFLGVTYSKSKTISTRETASQLPSRLVASSASTASGWNTLLQGTIFETGLGGADIRVGVGAAARADAAIILEGIKTTITQSKTKESNYVLWQRQTGAGSTVETMTLPQFNGPKAPVFTGPVLAQVPAGDFKTQVQTLSKQPGMGYVQELAQRKDVNWQPVQLAYHQWSYSQQGLTPAGAALVGVAVAVATGGAGASVLGTTTTAGSAMANAAVSSLAAQASITLINNGGDIGQTLKDLGKSDTVKATIAAALTAGALEKIGALDSIKPLKGSEAFSDKLTLNLINAGGRALTNTAINGGSLEGALKDALIGGLVDTVHGQAASQIKGLEADYLAHKLAHALAGCAAGAAAGGACKDGAIGAAVGEVVAEMFKGEKPSITASDEAKKAYDTKVLTYSKLISGAVSAYAGGNAQTAITTAEIAVQNNYLSKPQLTALQSELNKCKENNCSETQIDAVLNKYVDLSAKNDAALAACTTSACVETHRKALADAASLSSSVMWQVAGARGNQQLINELMGRQSQANNLQYMQVKTQHIENSRKQLDQYVSANCKGLTQAACNTKLQDSQAFTNALSEIFLGFTPAGIAVDIKDLLQAQSMSEYSLAVLGAVLPGIGDGIKGIFKEVANSQNYRSLFLKSRSNLPPTWQVHHGIPQKYEEIFLEASINVHDIQFLRGVSPELHATITKKWNQFDKMHNGKPTAAQVADFYKIIDEQYGHKFIWPGY